MMIAYFKKYLCPHALILQNKQKEYIYLIINNMNTYKVLIQKFINHRILSFFITVLLYFISIRLHFHADKFYSSYFAICSFYYSQLLTH